MTELRLCSTPDCGHLFDEHHAPVLSFPWDRPYCFACDCEHFVDEPDYVPASPYPQEASGE